MLIPEATQKMIDFYHGDLHDIAHFLKVYAYAKTIAELEGVSHEMQERCELAAILHDIACPLCRKKYGEAAGHLQEKEGPALAEAFLAELNCPEPLKSRIAFLVGHHHTTVGVDGLDWQILLEADFLVNADEGHATGKAIEAMLHNVYRTKSGRRLLESVYLRGRIAE